MPYTVKVKKKPEKFLRLLTDKSLFRRLQEAINALASNPRPPDCLKMQGGEGLYRVQVGDYRIVYQIQDVVLVVLVVQIGNRRDVYR